MKFRKLTDKQNNKLKWGSYFIIMFTFSGLLITVSLVPEITLDNEKIHIGGMFGGDYYISEIKSVDTVYVHYSQGLRRGYGSGLPGIRIGTYDIAYEKMPAKFCIYKNIPPFVKIRMNDNSLVLLNFNKPDKTVEFYNKLHSVLMQYNED